MMFSHNIIKKRILVFGANGMLGQRLVEFYSRQQGLQLLSCSVEDAPVLSGQEYRQIDITRRDDVKDLMYDFYPDVIINAAAYTNVDLSEKEKELAWKTNVKGVEYITEVSRVIDSHIVHISTDYIFNGKNGPYSEKDKPSPLGYYARTKLASENVLRISGTYFTILRTNVLYGIARNSRPDFVRWVVNSVRGGKQIKIVTDQINNPTFIDDLIQAISKVIEYKKYGVYNIGGKEFLSRYDFTMKIADFFHLDKKLILPITTDELNQAAARPLKSGLIILKAETELGYKPHSIEESLAKMKRELSL
jgi:dTDP-4-dehydrorhamnose reductase